MDNKDYYHPVYARMCADYQTVRDCFIGSSAVKAAADRYLPKLSGQSMLDYENYKRRALFFPITGKTTSTLVGFATSQEPEVKFPPEMAPLFKDDQGSYQFTEFYVRCLQENLLMGRYGVLIDAPISGAPLPKLITYAAEDIVNWFTDESGNLIWILLREMPLVQDPKNKFKLVQTVQYRYLSIETGVYTVVVYDKEMKPISPEIRPTFRGQTINFIPITIFGASGVHVDVDMPPMLDIATINISHYLNSADLEWGRHFTGLPTPVVIGVDTGEKMMIGGTSAWVLPNPEADAKYLEFLGQGLGSLENAMKEKVSLMATMSARLVDSSTKGSEATETVRLRYMSETASLKHLVIATEAGLNLVYTQYAQLMNFTRPTISLNKEILVTRLTAGELKELFQAHMNGQMSKENLIWNLRRSGLIDPTRTDEEEGAAIMDPAEIAKMLNPVKQTPAQA